jgi:2-oxoglutarate dehydrogenase E1 component
MLPHGSEGQGPEHSSARPERFLQLCAQQNMQVCVPTAPAQMFHMLRRQLIRPYRKPLVVMSPKSLLRHTLSVSTLDDLASGAFQPVIPEQDTLAPSKVRRVVLCSGKVYYDLLQARRERQGQEIAIVRIEQLYPFPHDQVRAELQRYNRARQVVWTQEEPRNQGAWDMIKHRLQACLGPSQRLGYAGRPPFAAPAVGYLSMHIEQQKALVDEALTLEPVAQGVADETVDE